MMKRYTHINEAAAQYDPNAFEQFCKEQYIASESKNYLNIDVIMPDFRNWYIPAAPTDLKALMQNLSATEERLFKNINNMMSDPTTTYNAAEDYATEAFGSLKGKISLVRADYLKESLNEGIGDAVGSIASSALDGLASVATSLGKAIAPAGAGAYGLGYATGYFGDAGGPNYYNDDALDANSNAVKNTEQALDNSSFKGQDAIEAIDTYVNNIINSLAGLDTIFGCSPEAYVKFKTLVQSALNNCGLNVKEFVKKNDVILKELENNLAKTRNSQLNAKFHKQAIITEFYKLCADHADIFSEKTKQTMLSYVANFKNDDYTSALKFYQKTKELLKDIGGPNQEVINNFLFNVNEHVTQMPIGESTNYQGHHLNEADSAIPKKPVIDCTDFYNRVHAELSKSIEGMLSVSGSKIPGVAEAQKEMQELLTKATQEINTKIEQVCRTSTTDTGGVFANVSKFLSKHPMKADELKNLWARYASVLQQRMDNRIRQMGDTRDKTKAVGWSYAVIRNVVPTTIARMLTYKYLLLFLKEKNVYSFTPRLQQTLDREWNKQKQTIMDQDKYFFKDILMHYTSSWTSDGKNIMELNMNGQVSFTGSNNMPYLSVYLMNLNEYLTKTGYYQFPTDQVFSQLWNLYTSNEPDEFLKLFAYYIMHIAALPVNNKALLYNELLKSIVISNDVKDKVNEAYKLIIDEPNSLIQSPNAAQKKIGYVASQYATGNRWLTIQKDIDKFEQLYHSSNSTDKEQLLEELKKIDITEEDFLSFVPTHTYDINQLYQTISPCDYMTQIGLFRMYVLSLKPPMQYYFSNIDDTITLAKFIKSDFLNILTINDKEISENYEKLISVLTSIDNAKVGKCELFIKLCDDIKKNSGNNQNTQTSQNELTVEAFQDYIKLYDPTYKQYTKFEIVLNNIPVDIAKIFKPDFVKKYHSLIKNVGTLLLNRANIQISDVLPDASVKEYLDGVLIQILDKITPEIQNGYDNVIAEFREVYDELHWVSLMAQTIYDVCNNCPDNKKALIYQTNREIIGKLISSVDNKFKNVSKSNINNIVKMLADSADYKSFIDQVTPDVVRTCIQMVTDVQRWKVYVNLKSLVTRLMPNKINP